MILCREILSQKLLRCITFGVKLRFIVLPYAREIVEKSTTIQNVEKRGKRMFYALEAVVMVKENGKKDAIV